MNALCFLEACSYDVWRHVILCMKACLHNIPSTFTQSLKASSYNLGRHVYKNLDVNALAEGWSLTIIIISRCLTLWYRKTKWTLDIPMRARCRAWLGENVPYLSRQLFLWGWRYKYRWSRRGYCALLLWGGEQVVTLILILSTQKYYYPLGRFTSNIKSWKLRHFGNWKTNNATVSLKHIHALENLIYSIKDGA